MTLPFSVRSLVLSVVDNIVAPTLWTGSAEYWSLSDDKDTSSKSSVNNSVIVRKQSNLMMRSSQWIQNHSVLTLYSLQ